MGVNDQITFDNNAAGKALTTNLRLSQILGAEIGLLLADRASLYGHPAIPLVGDLTGSGSDTLRHRLIGLDGYDEMAAAAAPQNEINAFNPTALSDGHVDIALVRAAISREVSDLAVLSQFGSPDVDPYKLAESTVGAFLMYFTSQVATAGASFGSSVGSASRDMDVSDFYDALFTLELANVPGPYVSILHPRQVADFQSALRSEPNALAMSSDTQSALQIKGQGSIGSYMGVELFKSSKITAGGGAKKGFMMGYGAMGYVIGRPAPFAGAAEVQMPAGVPIAIEFERSAAESLTRIVSTAYIGVSILQDSMGVLIATDAA